VSLGGQNLQKAAPWMKPTLIIVEDHAGLRNILFEWLQVTFPEVLFLSAETGEEAIRLAHLCEPLAVLMDIEMPGISGIEAARIIKTDFPKTVIVMHTIHDDRAYRDDAASAGATVFVSKRRTQTDLLPILRNLFSSTGLTLPGQKSDNPFHENRI
jgi:two-component system, NarL family, nitrate/nitrite response regulator NarL